MYILTWQSLLDSINFFFYLSHLKYFINELIRLISQPKFCKDVDHFEKPRYPGGAVNISTSPCWPLVFFWTLIIPTKLAFGSLITVSFSWSRRRVGFLGPTSYTLLPSLQMHVVLSRELRMEKMLNKHPWAGEVKAEGEHSAQRGCCPSALQAERAGHYLIPSTITYKALFWAPCWALNMHHLI